jgi:hypothetical protein
MLRHLSVLLAAALILSMAGCTLEDRPEDNTANQLQRLAPPWIPTLTRRM